MKEFNLRFILRNKKTNEILEIYNNLFDYNASVLTYPINMNEFEILRIDRPIGRKCSRNENRDLYENDIVDVYDWNKDKTFLYKTKIVFIDGCFNAEFSTIEDNYDFIHKSNLNYVMTDLKEFEVEYAKR